MVERVASSERDGLVVTGFVSCAVAIPPLILQLQQRNLVSSILMASIVISNLTRATNALIWHSREQRIWWDGRVFCDVQIRLHMAMEVAVLGAATCIFRQLGLIFRSSMDPPTRARKRRTRLIEFTLCVAVPLLRAGLLYIVQPDRYWIVRLYGCAWSVDTSWPSYVLVFLWQPLVSVIGLVYAAITGLRILSYTRHTSSVLGHGQNTRNKSRIMRLYTFGAILFVSFVPLQVLWLYQNLPPCYNPYSWSRVHPPDWWERTFFTIRYSGGGYQWLIWQYLNVFYSISVTILIGLGPDAIDSYKAWLAPLRPMWQRLFKKKTTSIIPDCSTPQTHEMVPQSQVMGRYELEAMSTT